MACATWFLKATSRNVSFLHVLVEREHFLIDVGDEEVLPAVAVEIGGIHAHAGAGAAVLAESHFGRQRDLFPLGLAFGIRSAVHEEEVLHGVVGHEEVHAAVVIDVGGHHAQAFAQGLFDVGAAAHFGERAVAVVVEQQARGGFEDARNAVEMLAQFVVAAGEVAVGAVVHKTADEEIEAAVVIEIEPDGAGGPVVLEDFGAQAGLLADIGEGAVAVVVVENGPAVGGDEEVGEAVVIVVADRHAHAEGAAGHARLFGHIGERAVAIVLVERVAESVFGGL